MTYNILSIILLFSLCCAFFIILGKTLSLFTVRHLFIIITFSIINLLVLIYSGTRNLPVPVLLSFIYFVLLPECVIIYRRKFRAIAWGVLMFTFFIICARGICTSFYCLITKSTVYDVMHSVQNRTINTVFTVLILFAFAPIFFKIYPVSNLRHIINTPLQYNMIVAAECVITAYLMFLNFSYYFDIRVPNFALFYIVSIIVFLFAHFAILSRTLRESMWLDEELKGKILAHQLDRQIAHYKAYQQHVEGYLEFKQNYNVTTGILRNMILSQNYKGALEVLQSADENLNQLQKHKELCNHPLVDAMLQDYARFCREQNINYSLSLYIPDWLKLSDLEFCKLFSNILDNACESCGKCEANSAKEISLSSNITSGWFNIISTNTMRHAPKMKDGKLATTKSDAERHGVGTKIIQEIAQARGGFAEFRPDTELSLFSLNLHFPIPIEKNANHN